MIIDEWIELTEQCTYLPEKDFRELCELVCDVLVEESNLQPISSPVTVCGDIHGQYYDLMELFSIAGPLPDTSYIFMGDFVDRGYYSIETLTRLLVMKAKYPDKIILLRGNHESRLVSTDYGFYDECLLKYGNPNIWRMCCQVFDLLPIAALIDEQVMCVHGGLSPLVKTLDQLRTIPRDREIPSEGALCDLVWSDPDEVVNWTRSQRGAGWLFGGGIVSMFNHLNDLTLICRSHQLVMDGFKIMFEGKLATVWSAPNYYYRCGNIASVFSFSDADTYEPKLFDAVPNHKRVSPAKRALPYFV